MKTKRKTSVKATTVAILLAAMLLASLALIDFGSIQKSAATTTSVVTETFVDIRAKNTASPSRSQFVGYNYQADANKTNFVYIPAEDIAGLVDSEYGITLAEQEQATLRKKVNSQV